MQNSTPTDDLDADSGRWALLRDLIRFQLKLLMDGLRDLLMSPVSVVAAVVGLLLEPRDPRRYFERTLEFGRRTEEWINLFDRPLEPEAPGIDELFGNLESRLVEQYRRGGLTSSAKHTIDSSLNRLHRAVAAVRARGAAALDNQSTDDAGS